MRTWSRHNLALFLGRLGWAFLALTAFVGLVALTGVLARHPYLPVGALLRRLPELLLLFVPLVLPVACLVAGMLCVAEARRGGGLMWALLAGRDPRRYQLPILVCGATFALIGWWLQASVLPHARHRTRSLLADLEEAGTGPALRMATDPGLLRGLRVAFEDSEEGVMRGFRLWSRGGEEPLAIVGERATASLTPEGERLALRLERGRMLGLDEDDEPRLDVRFDTLDLVIDAGRLGRADKRDLLELRYYSDGELNLLPEQERQLYRHGVRPRQAQSRRVAGVPQVRAARAQIAALPLLFLLLVVAFLGGDHAGRRWRAALVAAACLLVLLPQTVAIAVAAEEGRLAGPWSAALPTAETAALLALGFVAASLGRLR